MGYEVSDLVGWAIEPDGEASEGLVRLSRALVGRDLSGIELIRRGSNVVLKSEADGVVLRLQHAELSDAVERNLLVVAEVASEGAPIVGPLVPQAVEAEGVVLTAWPLGVPLSSNDTGTLGQVLTRLHGTPPVSSLLRVEVSSRLEQRLAQLHPDMPAEIAAVLVDRASEAKEVLADVVQTGSFTLHGDAHLGNVVSLHGSPLLIDLDDLCVGPREFDLVPSLISYRRFTRDETLWARLVENYGPDIDWDVLESLVAVREASMNTWLSGLWSQDQAAQAELRHRVETWGQPWHSHKPWTAI